MGPKSGGQNGIFVARQAMRRSEQYTVPDKLISIPSRETYRRAFHDLPWLQRIYLLIRTWFGSADITTVIKEHELDEVKRRVVARDATVADVTIPALKNGFHTRARAVALKTQALKTALSQARGSAAGAFLRAALEHLDPQLAETILASTTVPDDILSDPAATVASARKVVVDHLHQALEINKKAITGHLDPVWQCLESLAALGTVDFAGLIPEGSSADIRTPMRIVRQPLTQLACTVELCLRNRHRSATRLAMDFAGRRTGKHANADDAIWEAIDELNTAVPLLDLVRLAADEPRLTLAQLSVQSGWWARFSAAWMEAVNVGPELLRRRSMNTEELLRNHFGVSEPPVTWIPPSLFQRSAGALRRLTGAQRFRDTRTMAGALAREQDLMSTPDRARILEVHVELDKAFSRLEEMLGSGEERGTVGDELRRLTHSETDGAVAGMHKINIYSKYRPDVRVLIDQAADALETIATLFDTNRRQVRRALKAHTVRLDIDEEDLPLTELFDLITGSYQRLAVALRSLVRLEQEMITGPAGGAGDDGASPADTNSGADSGAADPETAGVGTQG